jgi:hypothetical protein
MHAVFLWEDRGLRCIQWPSKKYKMVIATCLKGRGYENVKWDVLPHDLVVRRPLLFIHFLISSLFNGRTQWPHGLRHEASSRARTLGPWIPIPLEAWRSMCVYSVLVLFCV